MIPFIDTSLIANNTSFLKLAEKFGLLPRLNLYNQNATTDGDQTADDPHDAQAGKKAIDLLNIIKGVLDGHELKREAILDSALTSEAGTVLAAVEYALATIAGHPPEIQYNSASTPARIVLTAPA